jgi:rhombotail lipoprotein
MQRQFFGRLVVGGILLVSIFALWGCKTTMAEQKQHHRNSLIDYLYPGNQPPQEMAAAPTGTGVILPARVGIAFAPDQVVLLSEKDKLGFLRRIREELVKYPFISSAEMIPSQHLAVGGGFTNLEQLRQMYGTDLIALVSYDQMQHTDEGFSTISYWTIVGLYAVKGEKNDTNTMMDLSMFHVPSRKMLLHAAGTSQVRANATYINLSEQLRNDSITGFSQATDNLIENLRGELVRFQQQTTGASGGASPAMPAAPQAASK